MSELKNYVLDINITKKISFRDIFGNDNPIEVDVGCGKGRFLIARANQFAETNFLGIERMRSRQSNVNKKINRHNLENVYVTGLEASYVVENQIEPDSVSVYHIFFPDPWPKRRHHKRRLFSESFLSSIHNTLIVNGRVNIATDHLDYFDVIYEILSGDSRFNEVETFEPEDHERTGFELMFMGQGLKIGRCSFVRSE
jgi:tRNA (guanine-N7-)-methyltransferase